VFKCPVRPPQRKWMRSRADAAAAAAHAGGAAPGVLGGEHSEQAVEEGRSADRRSVASIDLHVPDKQRRAGLHLHHPARWSTLFLWWVTHSLVGGVVRVVNASLHTHAHTLPRRTHSVRDCALGLADRRTERERERQSD